MLSEGERQVLQMLLKDHVLTRSEFQRAGVKNAELVLRKLMGQGFIAPIEALGSSIAITQKGMRAANGGKE